MTKTELSEVVAERMNIPKSRAQAIVDELFNAMKSALICGERIELRGFGTFTPKTYKQKKGRNPVSGESLVVTEKRSICFRAGKDLKDRVDTKIDDE